MFKEKLNIKKEKKGIIFGKFYPLHMGHIDFIQRASEYVDILYVTVCTDNKRDLELFNKSKMKKMPTINDRINFIEGTFRGQNNIKVIHLEEDGIESYPNGWKDWTKKVAELMEKYNIKIDVIFTNEKQDVENYKKIFIENMDRSILNENFEVKTIDILRNNFSISATEIRENPYKNWEYIPKSVREFFL